MQLSDLEIRIWAFQVLLLKLISWYQNSVRSKSTYSPILSKTLLSTLPYTSWVMNFSSCQPSLSAKCHLYYSFREFFSQPWVSSDALISTLLDSQSELSIKLCIFLSAALFSPALHPAAQTALGSPDSSAVSPQLGESVVLQLGLSSLHTDWKVPQGIY